MIFIYAKTFPEAIAIVREFRMSDRPTEWVYDGREHPIRGGQSKPVVVYYGCQNISEAMEDLVASRGGIVLPLMCRHVAHP